ncbi:twitching motility protein PilT [Paenibacillus shirakamiensis]|uniref:Twitching motility protein PilT n=1 Tax=Paenibacillus shirakamiensis TaxID=1265935 RepID=A0ABS4JIP5_9BACL|nr:PilT/PilU family type 4a pilus ATPase [Paenibacillus shirakamiensis]MBP2001575.1 twitching motility protein PilT [Paenibacillus shirakamiensis]
MTGHIDELLILAGELRASDLHISVGSPPVIRVDGVLRSLGEQMNNPIDIQEMTSHLLRTQRVTDKPEEEERDFAYAIEGVGRYRVHIYRQQNEPSLAIRLLPGVIPSIEDLALPQIIQILAQKMQGLILVTGPTGSGKSSTLAAIVGWINRTQHKHIITLEDPVEFLHGPGLSLIHQREIGVDTTGFAQGLKAALRQDPDVIMVGELRDLETISAAMTAAETGHLVLATLHTSDAPQTIDRIIDAYPASQQSQIRVQLASVLTAVISQRLLPSPKTSGRVCVTEVLLNTPAAANLIRTEKTHQLKSIMQTGRQLGMHTMDMKARELLQQGVLDHITAKPYLMEASS